jgi:hypothetical protein
MTLYFDEVFYIVKFYIIFSEILKLFYNILRFKND